MYKNSESFYTSFQGAIVLLVKYLGLYDVDIYFG